MCYFIYRKMRSKSSDKPKTYPQCPHQIEGLPTRCIDCKAEKSALTKYRWKIILCLVWPYALQALDSTIIASALPWIASDFERFSEQNWIISAFNLTSAAFIPCWAQLANIFGRNAALIGAILFMLLGSALCTGSPTNAFPMLLLGRGFQGLAAAGLNVVVRTILTDRVSLKESAKNWAIFAFVGGIAYGIGPVIGGYLTNANWRWCFGINLPIAAVALLVTFFILRKELVGPQPIPGIEDAEETGRKTRLIARLKTVDFGGQLLFLFGFGLIILALTWGGATYSWASAPVLVPLIIGGVLAGCFFIWERQLAPGRSLSKIWPWQQAMIPWALLTNRDIGMIFYAECCTGMSTYAVLYFCNIYFIAVLGKDSTSAGVQLLYFTPGIAAGIYGCTFMCNYWPRMTFPPLLLGTILEGVGIGIIALGVHQNQVAVVYAMMGICGAGMGLRFMVAPIHGIALFKQHRASVIGMMAVAIPFGGTVGLTIMSAVFNNSSGLNTNSNSSSTVPSPQGLGPNAIEHAKNGVVWAFVSILPFILVAWAFTLCLGNVKLAKQGSSSDNDNNEVIHDIYLLSLIRGKQSYVSDNSQLETPEDTRNKGILNPSDEQTSPA